MKEVWIIYEDILKNPISKSLEFQKEKWGKTGAENLFKEINNGWELSKSGKRSGHQVHEANKQIVPLSQPKMSFSKTFYLKNRKYKKSNTKKRNLKTARKEEDCNLQRNLQWDISEFLRRTLTGQETVGWYIQSNERKKQSKIIHLGTFLMVQQFQPVLPLLGEQV